MHSTALLLLACSLLAAVHQNFIKAKYIAASKLVCMRQDMIQVLQTVLRSTVPRKF